MTHHPDTCIHRTKGLCSSCQRDADEDPESWTEYGNHPDGIRNSRDLLAEAQAANRAAEQNYSSGQPPTQRDDIPF